MKLLDLAPYSPHVTALAENEHFNAILDMFAKDMIRRSLEIKAELVRVSPIDPNLIAKFATLQGDYTATQVFGDVFVEFAKLIAQVKGET